MFYRNEIASEPSVVVDCLVNTLRSSADGGHCVANIRKLGGRVVPPNRHVLNLVDWNAKAVGDLRLGSVLKQ